MVKKKKDFGEHDKKTAARERKAADEKERRKRSEKEQADRYWAEAGEGALTKAQSRRKEQEKQRLEAQAKKQELKQLAKAEEEEITTSKRPKGRPSAPKVTRHELLQEQERLASKLAAQRTEREKVERKEIDEEAYAQMVDVENLNRASGDIDARNVSDAITALQNLTTNEDPISEDQHPEKRRKAAYKKFYETELSELKEEKPGLKLSQYKDMIFKRWLKSPENPMNQQSLNS